MNKFITTLLILFTLNSFSQSEKQEAKELCREAITEMESGKTEEARKKLEKAIKLDPENITYPYEMA